MTTQHSFLERIKFPSHALVVQSVNDKSKLFPFFNTKDKHNIFKGIKEYSALEQASQECQKSSGEKLVLVETDMRAHINPTRQKVIRKLAINLVHGLKCVEAGHDKKLINVEAFYRQPPPSAR